MLSEHAGNVERDVAVADDGNLFGFQWPGAGDVGVTVIPTDKVRTAIAARKLNPWDIKIRVLNGAGRENHRVVVLLQILQGDVGSVVHVAKKANLSSVEHFPQRGDDALDARVVRRNPVANQAVGGWQALKQVNGDIKGSHVLEQNVSCVDSCGTGSHYC